MQHEMEAFRDGADALERAAEECGEIGPQARLRQSGALEGRFVVAGHDPGFVGDARGVGSEGDIIAASLDHAGSLTLLLSKNVAEDAAFLGLKILTASPQLVEHAARYKHCGSELRSGMAEFLAGVGAVVLVETDVFDAWIVFEIKDTFGGEAQELADLIVAGIPEMAVMAGILDQNFMRAD